MPTPVDDIWSDLGDAFWGYELLYYGGAIAATGVMSQSGADNQLRIRANRHLDSGSWNEAANIGGYVVPLATAPTIWAERSTARAGR